jgi:exodeoxyribonuclease V alpha subunit
MVGGMQFERCGQPCMLHKATGCRTKSTGLQFKATFLKCTPPHRGKGLKNTSGSGLIKGIGPIYAKKLVEKFGKEIFTIIDQYSVQLEEVDGIGPGRRQNIKTAWVEQKAVCDIMIFLHSLGLSHGPLWTKLRRTGHPPIRT